MRRIPIILLLLAAFFCAPAAHAVKTRGPSRASAARAASHKQKPAAPKVKRNKTRRSKAGGRVRTAIFRRVRHTQQAIPSEITAERSAEPPPAAEAASLQATRKPMPPPLRGSYESLLRQNEKTEDDHLERIEDDDDLNDRIARKMLVPVPVSAALTINGSLPENRRYCRPWTARFLTDLARAHAAVFHGPLEVSSAVRTVAYQKQLMKVNGNATAAEGDVASPHLTGATIDIAKNGLTRQQVGWMRSWLAPLQEAGKIDVEEEFQQSCFHITVYKSYIPDKPVRKPPAQASEPQGKTSSSGF